MRESRNKLTDRRVSKNFKHARKYNRYKDINKKKVLVNQMNAETESLLKCPDSDVEHTQYKQRGVSPVKSECSEDGNGSDHSASSSITGAISTPSNESRSNQSPTPVKKSSISGIDFHPGTRLEAKDLGNGVWYAVKVVEVDWEEEEILIHFEKWSQRYDEWIPMDSSRLRPVTEPPGGFVKKVPKIFKVGDKVMATWSDSRKYPATVKTVLGNDKYEVLFFDGFSKTIKGGRMISLKDEELAKIQKLQPGIGPSNDTTNPILPNSDANVRVINSPMATALGTKEERRERKRKLNVAELFHFKKRPRLENPGQLPADNKKPQRGGRIGSRGGRRKNQWTREPPSSATDSLMIEQEQNETQLNDTLQEKSVEKHERVTLESKRRDIVSKGKGRWKSGDDSEKVKKSKGDTLQTKSDEDGRTIPDKRVGPKLAKLRDGVKKTHPVLQGSKDRVDRYDVPRGRKKESEGDGGKSARIIDDWEPVGEPAYIVDGTDGPRKSIIVADHRIPTGWTRHTIQRMSGHSAGKWDVFFVNPEGRKFRTRHELRVYYEEHGEVFPTEQFDFSLGRRKNKNTLDATNPEPTITSTSNSGVSKIGKAGAHLTPSPADASQETPIRRVKTLLPRVRPPNMESTGQSIPPMSPGKDSLESSMDGSVVFGGLKIQKENDAFRCPKEGCNKNFRKENLLQMHMKHYHPEYNRFVASTPNVADLAYARTVGERVEEIRPRTPGRPSLLEKISRFEALTRARGKHVEPPLSPNVSSQSAPAPASPGSSIFSLSPVVSLSSRISPVTSRRIGDAESSESTPPINTSEFVSSPCSPKPDCGEISHSTIRTLVPVTRTTFAETSNQGSSNQDTELIGLLSEGHMEVNTQSPCEVTTAIKEEKENDASLSCSTSHTKSLRLIRRRHMSDFHMEPLLKKRKSDAEETSQSMVLNGNSRQTRTESLRREELINCTCGYPEEDGLMIQCDLCMCWQHGLCNKIEHEDHVPEKYVCYICQNPPRERQSKHFLHDQDWLKEGRLPSLSFRSKNVVETVRNESMFKRSHELTGSLLQLQEVIHSLRVKVNIAEKKDHPKMYLWAQSWEKAGSSLHNQSSMDLQVNPDNGESFPRIENGNKSKVHCNAFSAAESDCSSPSIYNSALPNEAENTIKNVGGINNCQLSESVNLIPEESDTKEAGFSHNTADTGEKQGTCKEERKSKEDMKLEQSNVSESGVPNHNINFVAEGVAAAQKADCKEETLQDLREDSKEMNEEKSDNSFTCLDSGLPSQKNVTDSPFENNRFNSSKTENDIENQEHFQISLSQDNLAEVSSVENPVGSIDASVEKETPPRIVQCAPQPEAPIDPAECRMTLLDHIDYLQHQVESRLANIESEIEDLERMDSSKGHEHNSDARTKETVQMLLRDLAALYNIAAFN